MKKSLLFSFFALLLATFWFGGISMADTTVTHHTENVVPGTYTLNWNTGFTAWTITVTDWTTTITILDRNLWATAAWTWCEDINYDLYHPKCSGIDNTYWYLFQWWNNYWFPSHWELSNMSSTLVSSPINIPYSSSTFITGHSNWMDDNNVVNLWWWTTNDSSYSASNRQITNAEERQWPCPDWFHVPSAWELYKLFSMFDNDASDIHENLKIPYAGRRQSSDNALSAGALREQGYRAGLLSSSINSNSKSNYLYWSMIIYTDSAFINNDSRSTAQSVRCFYNNYAEYWVTTPTEITNINISWITNPIIWQQPTVAWLTVTSTPENAIDLDSVLVPAWRASDNWTDNGYRNLIHDQSGISWSRPPFNKTPLFYFIRIIFTPKDWYTLAENYTVTANDWYSSIRTWKSDNLYNPLPGSSLNDPGSQNKYSAWLNYIHVIYNTADIPEVTPVTNISITWITLPVGWNIPTKEWIVSATTWITVSNRNTIWNMNYDMVRCSVDTNPELCDVDLPSFVAWTKYNLYIPFTVDDWYVLANSFTATDGTNNAIETDWDIKRVVFQYTATAPAAYTIRWLNYNWDALETDENVAEWTTPTYDWDTPTKAEDSSCTYTFDKWTPDIVAASDNATYTATFTCTAKQSSSSSSSSSWGGWGGKTIKKDTTTTETDKTTEKEDTDNDVPLATENNSDTPTNPSEVLDNWFTKEQNDAYKFAFENWITTMEDIEKADMEGWLTRVAMAKMLSQYAINILKKTPDTNKECKFSDVTEELDAQYNNWVTLSCQLWIMGVWITEFRPNDEVTRAEFGTALSRMIYGTADWEWAYYKPHLEILKQLWIITNDNPELKELRGYVMIMLMRSAN